MWGNDDLLKFYPLLYDLFIDGGVFMALILTSALRGSQKTPKAISVQKAQAMLAGMIKDNPRYRVYLSKQDIRFVAKVLSDRTHSSLPGFKGERFYGLSKTLRILSRILKKCRTRQIAFTDYKTLQGYHTPLRMVIAKLIVGTPIPDSKQEAEIRDKVGLDSIGSESGAPLNIRNKRNAAVLRYVYQRHFNPDIKRFHPESRDIVESHRPLKEVNQARWLEAIEELEYIFSNPGLLHEWAPDFPSQLAF